MPELGFSFQHNPEGGRRSQNGASKQGQSPLEEEDVTHGFIFHLNNPHVLEFLQLRARGEAPGSLRFKEVILEMQNWEIGCRGDSPKLRAALRAALEAMEAKPIPVEELSKDPLDNLRVPLTPKFTIV